MNVSEELWRLYYSTLTGNADIMAIANRVYDKVAVDPYGTKTAYISRGPSNTVDDGAECAGGWEVTTQIDVWSKRDGSIECDNLVDLIRRALHEQDLTLVDNALVETRVVLTNVFRDPNGIATHGVVQVSASVEEPD